MQIYKNIDFSKKNSANHPVANLYNLAKNHSLFMFALVWIMLMTYLNFISFINPIINPSSLTLKLIISFLEIIIPFAGYSFLAGVIAVCEYIFYGKAFSLILQRFISSGWRGTFFQKEDYSNLVMDSFTIFFRTFFENGIFYIPISLILCVIFFFLSPQLF